MKRAICLTLTLLFALLCVLPAQATSSYGEHAHSWVDTGDRREPTCTDTGVAYEYCSVCGTVHERVLPALGHYFPTENWQVTKQPTCTEAGQEMNHCARVNYGKVCGYEWRRELPALGHDWSEWTTVKPAVPGEPGLEERKCARCGLTEQRPIYALDDSDKTAILLSVTIPGEQSTYLEGEIIPYIYEVTNVSGIPLYIDGVHFINPDSSFGRNPDTAGVTIAAGETLYFSSDKYEVKKSDIADFAPTLTRQFRVLAYLSASDAENGADPVKDNGFVNVNAHIGDVNQTYKLFIDAEVKNPKAFYSQGETVYFDVSITNNSDVAMGLEDTWYKPPSGNSIYYWEILTLEAGQTKSFEAEYDLTAEDIALSGTKLRLEFQCCGGPNLFDLGAEPYTYSNIDVCLLPLGEDDDDSDLALSITKTEVSTPANGSFYEEGETLTCQIDIRNNRDESVFDVSVEDRDKEGILSLYAGGFGPHEAMQFFVDHVIDKEDCENGSYENTAYAWWHDETTQEGGINEITDSVTVAAGAPTGVQIVKTVTSAPVNGSFYEEDEPVCYTVSVTNNTHNRLWKLSLWDELLEEDEQPLSIASTLEPGKTVSVSYTHIVTWEDVLTEIICNVAKVTWELRDPPGRKVYQRCEGYSNEVVVPTSWTVPDPDDGDRVELTKYLVGGPANGSFYEVGEPIVFHVDITNNYVYAVEDVCVSDPILGSGDDAVLENHFTMAPDESRGYLVTYIPTQQDADNGTVLNWAEGSYLDTAAGEYVPVVSNTVTVPVGKTGGVPKLTLTKCEYSAPANGMFYRAGETITYRFILTNGSDKTVYYVGIYDPLNTDGENIVPVYKASVMGPYEVVDVLFSYTVTEEDVNSLTDIINQGLAEFYPDPEGEDCTVFSNTVIVPIGKDVPPQPEMPLIDMTLSKTAVNPPANGLWYVEGEQVVFMITFTNTGDVPLYLTDYTDEVFNASGSSSFTVDLSDAPVAPHSSVSFSYPYTVTQEDALGGWFRNEVDFRVWTEVEFFGHLDFYPWTFEEAQAGPGDPAIREYPVAFKYEVSTPLNGASYTEGEQVEYDVILYNSTGRTFKNVDSYDILLTEVPGFWLNWHDTLGSTPIVEHVVYLVTDMDVFFGEIYNTAWFTMEDEDGSVITVTSNEVAVKTTDVPPPPHTGNGKASCVYSLEAEGEGVAVYKNDFCCEHAALERRVQEMVKAAKTQEDRKRAYDKAVELWTNSLTALYTRRIGAADAETKAALERDLSMLTALIDAYKARLEAEGASPIAVSKALVEFLRDRTCELCYTFGHAPEARLDLSGTAKNAIGRRAALSCGVSFTLKGDQYYTKELNACEAHLPLVKAIGRVLASAGEETALKGAAWNKAGELWQNCLDGEYKHLADQADPELKHRLLKEQAAFNAFVKTRGNLYVLLYPDDALVQKKLCASLRCEKVLELCK